MDAKKGQARKSTKKIQLESEKKLRLTSKKSRKDEPEVFITATNCPPGTRGGFKLCPKEPPASECNDLISTVGEVVPDLGNIRVSQTASLQINLWRIQIMGTAGDIQSLLYQY